MGNENEDRAIVVLYNRLHLFFCPDKMPPRDVPAEFKVIFQSVNMTSVLKGMIKAEPKTVSSGALAMRYGIPLGSVKSIRSNPEPGNDGNGSGFSAGEDFKEGIGEV